MTLFLSRFHHTRKKRQPSKHDEKAKKHSTILSPIKRSVHTKYIGDSRPFEDVGEGAREREEAVVGQQIEFQLEIFSTTTNL